MCVVHVLGVHAWHVVSFDSKSCSSKTVGSHEVCASMIDLVETVCTSAPR